jgi:hypothetical protein
MCIFYLTYFIINVFLVTNEFTHDCLKNKIKIYIKTAPACFDAVTPSSGSALFVLAKVTVVKIVSMVNRCVQHTHINKSLLIYAASSPPI